MGVAASEGYAIGRLYIHLEKAEVTVPRKAQDPDLETSRFLQARERACAELGVLYHRALARVGEHHSSIFKIHLALLQDQDFFLEVRDCIREKGVTAETAVQEVGQRFFRMFEEMDDDYMKARGADVRDIVSRLLWFLLEAKDQQLSLIHI